MFSWFSFSKKATKAPCLPRKRSCVPLFLEALEDRKVPALLTLGGSVYDDKNGNGLREAAEVGLGGVAMELRTSAGVLAATSVTSNDGGYRFDRFNALPIQPLSQRVEQVLAPSKTNFLKNITINGFDSQLGTLERVDVTLTSEGTAAFKVENQEEDLETITLTPKGTFRLSVPGLSPIDLAVKPNPLVINLGAYDGKTDFTGGSGQSPAPISLSATQSISFSTPDSLAAFLKTQISMGVSSKVTLSTEGPANQEVRAQSMVGLKVLVVYHYRAIPALDPGTYTISQPIQPVGFLNGAITQNNITPVPGSINQNSFQVTLGTTSINTIHFGELKPSTLSGVVRMLPDTFSSASTAGVGIAGILVSLRGKDDIGQAVNVDKSSNYDGTYSFGDLRPGTYSLTASAGKLLGSDAQAGTSGGTAGINSISQVPLLPGSMAKNYIFNEIIPSALVGMAFQDNNANGVFDGADTVLANLILTLTGTDYKGNAIKVTANTDSYGEYGFGTLLPGTYSVTPALPTGLIALGVKPGSQGGTVEGASVTKIRMGQDVYAEGYDFPFVNPAKISGYVFLDKNNDGKRATPSQGMLSTLSVDPGIGSVVVNLSGTDSSGKALSLTTNSTASGLYSFPAVRPGTYKIQIVTPFGFIEGMAVTGSVGGSAINANTISSLSLTSGQNATDYNFGLIKPTVISGFVGNDLAGNKRRDANDPGIAGVVVILTGVDVHGKAITLQTKSDVNGNYSFGTVAPGNYSLRLGQTPVGWSAPVTTVGTLGGKSVGQELTLTVGQDLKGVGYNFLMRSISLSKRQFINGGK